jgi:hypothetical protein
MRSRTKAGVAAVAAVLGLAGAIAVSVEAADQTGRLPASMADLSGAREVKVRDASDQVVLLGAFAAANAEGERKAMLSASSGTARGEAEVEPLDKNGAGFELEVDVEGLTANASYAIHLDGTIAGTVTTDADGKAEIELTSGGDR